MIGGRFWVLLIGAIAALLAADPALAADVAPKVDTSRPTPVVYPKGAQRAGEEGTVVLRVFVNTSGKPSRVNVVKSSGYPDLDNAAVETAFGWRYVPAIRDGDIASDWATVQVEYKLPTGGGM